VLELKRVQFIRSSLENLLPPLIRLVSLTLDRCSFDDDSLDVLCDFIRDNKSLKRLHYTRCKEDYLGPFFQVVGTSNLVELIISQYEIDRYVCSKIQASLSQFRHLYALTFEECEITSRFSVHSLLETLACHSTVRSLSLLEARNASHECQIIEYDTILSVTRRDPPVESIRFEWIEYDLYIAMLGDLQPNTELLHILGEDDKICKEGIQRNRVIHAEMKPCMFRLIKTCRAMALGKRIVSKHNLPVEIILMIFSAMLPFDHLKSSELHCVLDCLLHRRTIGRVVYEECGLMFTFPALHHLCNLALKEI
jgi:hypothetical protein